MVNAGEPLGQQDNSGPLPEGMMAPSASQYAADPSAISVAYPFAVVLQ